MTAGDKPAFYALILIKTFDEGFEVVFANPDDAHFAARILGGIGGVRGVDHDGRAELAANGARRRLGRIGRAEDLANFAHGINALIDKDNALLGAGFGPRLAIGFGRRVAGHEADDVVELLLAGERTEQAADLLLHLGRDGEIQRGGKKILGALGDGSGEGFLEHVAHRAVEFLGLRDGHAMHLDAGDGQSGAGKNIEDVAGAHGADR
jgi:hypothetical protein